MDDMVYDKPSMAQLAREKGVDPVELMIDMALERNFKVFFRAPLAAGARRLKQTASGILNTVVNGEIFLTNNEHTGATAGRLLRS